MVEKRTDLDDLEDDLDAFIRARVEAGLRHDIDGQIEASVRAALARNLQDMAVRLESLSKSVSAGGAATKSRLDKLERAHSDIERRMRALDGRRGATPRREPDGFAEAPGASAGVRRIDARLGGGFDWRQLAFAAIAVVLASGVAASVSWYLTRRADQMQTAAAAANAVDDPVYASDSQAGAGQPLFSTDLTDKGLHELAKSPPVASLCGAGACSFETLWPKLAPADQKVLLTTALGRVNAKCKTHGSAPPLQGAALTATWDATVKCLPPSGAPRLGGEKDYKAATRWLLNQLGSAP